MAVAKKVAGAAKVDALAMLKNLAKPGAAKSTKKADRNSFELTEDLGEVLRNWVPAKILFDRFDAHAKNLGIELKEGVFKLWMEQLWGNKAQPQNPKLSVDNDNGKIDCEGMFVVMEKYQVTVPDAGDKSVEEAFVDVLVEMANDEDAQKAIEGLNGKEFDKGAEVSMPIGQMIPGFNEALTLMKPGSEAVFVIPSSLAYGAEARGPIPANSVLVFELKLHAKK